MLEQKTPLFLVFGVFLSACLADRSDFYSFYGDQVISKSVDNVSEPIEFKVWTEKMDADVVFLDYSSVDGTQKLIVLSQIKGGKLSMTLKKPDGGVQRLCNPIKRNKNREFHFMISFSKNQTLEVSVNGSQICGNYSIPWATGGPKDRMTYRIGPSFTNNKNQNFLGCISAHRRYTNALDNDVDTVRYQINQKPKVGCDSVFTAKSIFLRSSVSSVSVTKTITRISNYEQILAFKCVYLTNLGKIFSLTLPGGYIEGSIDKAYICFAYSTQVSPYTNQLYRHCVYMKSNFFNLKILYSGGYLRLYINNNLDRQARLPIRYSVGDTFINLGGNEMDKSIKAFFTDITVLKKNLNLSADANRIRDVVNGNFRSKVLCLKSVILSNIYKSRNVSAIFKCWECEIKDCYTYLRQNPDIKRNESRRIKIDTQFKNRGNFDSFQFVKHISGVTADSSGYLGSFSASTDIENWISRGILKLTERYYQRYNKYLVIEMITKLSEKSFKINLPHGYRFGILDKEIFYIDKDIIDVKDMEKDDLDIINNLYFKVKMYDLKPYSLEKNESYTLSKLFIRNDTSDHFFLRNVLEGEVTFTLPYCHTMGSNGFYSHQTKIDTEVFYHGKSVDNFTLTLYPVSRNISIVRNSILHAKYGVPEMIGADSLKVIETNYLGREIDLKFTIKNRPSAGDLILRGRSVDVNTNLTQQKDIDSGNLFYTLKKFIPKDSFQLCIDSCKPGGTNMTVYIEMVKIKITAKNIYLRDANSYTFSPIDFTFTPQIPFNDLIFDIKFRPEYGTIYYDSMHESNSRLESIFHGVDFSLGSISYRIQHNFITNKLVIEDEFQMQVLDEYDNFVDCVTVNIVIDPGERLSHVSNRSKFDMKDKIYFRTNTSESHINSTKYLISLSRDLFMGDIAKLDKYASYHKIVRQPLFGSIVQLLTADDWYEDQSMFNRGVGCRFGYFSVDKLQVSFDLNSNRNASVLYETTRKGFSGKLVDCFTLLTVCHQISNKDSFYILKDVDIYIN